MDILSTYPVLWREIADGWTVVKHIPRQKEPAFWDDNPPNTFYNEVFKFIYYHPSIKTKIIYLNDCAIVLQKFKDKCYQLLIKLPYMKNWVPISRPSFDLEIVENELQANLQHARLNYAYKIICVNPDLSEKYTHSRWIALATENRRVKYESDIEFHHSSYNNEKA